MVETKKAVIGIGTLIVFISSVLVAAIGAGVILRTQSELQNTALRTGNSAREAVGKDMKIIKIDGIKDGNRIKELEMKTKVGAGGEGFNLENMIILLRTRNDSAALSYNSSRYFINDAKDIKLINQSPRWLGVDLDGDYKEDKVYVKNEDTLTFELTKDDDVDVDIPLVNESGNTIDDTFKIGDYGKIKIDGTIQEPYELEDMSRIYPTLTEEGCFKVDYAMEGRYHKDGYIKSGDVAKITMETPDGAIEATNLKINVQLREGVPLKKIVPIPDTLVMEKTTLHP